MPRTRQAENEAAVSSRQRVLRDFRANPARERSALADVYMGHGLSKNDAVEQACRFIRKAQFVPICGSLVPFLVFSARNPRELRDEQTQG